MNFANLLTTRLGRANLNSMNYVKNIEDVWLSASMKQLRDGAQWYEEAHLYCMELAEQYPIPGGADTIAAALATLSPCVSWYDNCKDLEAILNGHEEGLHAFKMNILKAQILLREGVTIPPTGPKVRAFYYSIIGRTDCPTIDRHAISVAMGRTMTDKELKATTQKPRVFRAIYDTEGTASYNMVSTEGGE
jgi:hypothetical protein